MVTRREYIWFLAAFFVLMFSQLGTQGQKVALVLSGGGSRGLAHVGVIKALEENHIPIDYITGTSMGAIIGGLYASGYSAKEIEQFVRSSNFDSWARGQIDESYIYYFKQPDPTASWVSLKIAYDPKAKKLKPVLPTNLISPYQMDFIILEYYASASAAAGYNFDSLFVPFRCVASDINSKVPVILRDGHLGSAIRASMTYPFYFKPIMIDSSMLFDGGLYNNFPVNVAQDEFHPDIIIGSKVASNYNPPEEDNIISQIQNMIVNETDYTVPGENGILIEPVLEPVNVIDFSLKDEFIDSGYVAALRSMDEIRSKVKDRISTSSLAMKRDEFNKKKPPLIIDTLIVTGLKKTQTYYVTKLLKPKSRYLTIDALKSEYFKLLGDNKIKYIYPELTYRPRTGFYELQMNIKRAEQITLEFGGNVSSSAATAAYIGLEYRLFNKVAYNFRANGYFGRFYTSGNAEVRFDFPLYFPFFASLDYTYNNKNYFKNTTYFFEDKYPSFLIQTENHLAFHLGIPATNRGKLAAGIFYGYSKDEYYPNNQFSRQDTADVSYFNFTVPKLFFELNSLNQKQFPTAGSFLSISLRYITGIEKTFPGSLSEGTGAEINKGHNWFQFRLTYDNYFARFWKFRAGFYADLLLSNQPIFSNYTETLLRTPCFDPLPEMKTLFLSNYRATNFASIGLKLILNIYKQLHFRAEGYLYQPYEELAQGEGNSTVKRREFSYRSAIASGSLVYHTPLGPVSLSFNYYDRAEQKFSVMFNIGYIIFNKSAFE